MKLMTQSFSSLASPVADGPHFRVLMTADTVGGVWTYALELARALQPEVEVILATMGGPLRPAQRTAAAEAGVEVRESSYKLEWMQDPWDDVARAGEWLLELEEELQPDLIHLNNLAHGHLPWQNPAMVVVHSCVYSWWRAVHQASPPKDWSPYWQIVRKGLARARAVVAPSRAMLREILRHYGPLENTQVIYNGLPPRKPARLAKEACVFCAARLWDDAKNVRTLVQAVEGLPWPLFVAGDAAEPGASPSPANQSVTSLGRLSPAEVEHWMNRAAIYALPARYEPFGLSILEAGLSNCALVLGDIPSLREIWADAAVYVDPNDPEALRHQLLTLMEDSTARTCLGAMAHQRARMFSLSATAFNYISLYRQLLLAQVAV